MISRSCRAVPLSVPLCFAFAVTLAHADGLTFSASLDEGLNAEVADGIAEPMWARSGTKVVEDGVSGSCAEVPAGGNLTYDAPGNCYWQRGTLAFWWRCEDPVGKVEFDVATIGAFEYFYFGRWFRLYCSGGKMYAYIVNETLDWKNSMTSCGEFQPEQGRWYHIAMAWDAARGFGIYVDGEKLGGRERPWYFWTHLNQIGLGVSATSAHAKASALRTVRFDEVRAYDRWLADEQIVGLARQRETTDFAPLDERAIAEHRVAALALEDPAGMAVAPLNGAWLTVAQPRVVTAMDVLRTGATGIDGNPASVWPSGYGYSSGGRRHDVTLAGEPINHVSMAATLRGAVQLEAGGELTSVLTRTGGGPVQVRALLDEPVFADAAYVTREIAEDPYERRKDGRMSELRLLHVAQSAEAPEGMTRLPLGLGDWQDLGADGRLVHDEYTLLDRACLAPGKSGAELVVPRARVLHILGPAVEQQTGVAAVGLELALRAEAGATVRVELVHPVNYERRALVVDAALDGSEGVLRLLLDHRDLLVAADHRLHVTLRFSRHVSIGSSALLMAELPVEEALAEYYPDQLRMVKHHFMRLSEARPWGWDATRIKKLAELFNAMDQLYALRPEEPNIRGYYHWIHYREPKPRPDIEPADPAMPRWAGYLPRLVGLLRDVPLWWVENRQADDGEFGSNDGLNDDSVLVQDFVGLAMMNGPDQRLIRAAAQVADNCWTRAMTDGINNKATDPLHAYEWGMNVNCMMAALDYGNPIYLERMMAMARHLDELTEINERGHRHYRSNHYGASGIVTEGRYGWDTTANALNMQAAALLAWYNGSPEPMRYMTEWASAWVEDLVDERDGLGRSFDVNFKTGDKREQRTIRYGFASILWACAELTGERRFTDGLRLLYEADRRHNPRLPASIMQIGDKALGAHDWDDFRADLLMMAAEGDLWGAPIRYTDTRPLMKWYQWRLTGEREAVVDALRATLSDMAWELPMYTVAEQSPDRLWLPQTLPNMLMLGDVAMVRNTIFPLHHVSWEQTGGEVAAWVLDKDDDRLRLWAYNTSSDALDCLMRVWKLRHGRYEVSVGADADEDGKFDGTPTIATLELARFEAAPLNLPPRVSTLVEVRLVEELDQIAARADLAVCDRDLVSDAETGELGLIIHNVGAAAAGAFVVRVDTDTGAQCELTVPGLSAPLDLQPRTHACDLAPLDLAGARELRVRVDPDGTVAEITESNNQTVIALPDWLD